MGRSVGDSGPLTARRYSSTVPRRGGGVFHWHIRLSTLDDSSDLWYKQKLTIDLRRLAVTRVAVIPARAVRPTGDKPAKHSDPRGKQL